MSSRTFFLRSCIQSDVKILCKLEKWTKRDHFAHVIWVRVRLLTVWTLFPNLLNLKKITVHFSHAHLDQFPVWLVPYKPLASASQCNVALLLCSLSCIMTIKIYIIFQSWLHWLFFISHINILLKEFQFFIQLNITFLACFWHLFKVWPSINPTIWTVLIIWLGLHLASS